MTDGGISIGMWGTVGTGSGQFTDPQGIAIGPDGSVYVTELGTDRVQKFDAEGNFITSWGGFGSGEGQFDNPYGITVDDEGAVFVSDLGNDRIQQFDSDGNFVTEWGEEGTGNGEFNAPIDIASGTGARLYVADSINGRIQWFSGTSCLGLTWYDEDPPLANDSVMTGQYWDIVKSGTVRVNLTLPQNNYANPQVCRKSFLTWTCGQDSFSSQSVTRNGLNTFGSTYLWAVGDCMVMTTPNIISRVYDLNTGEVTLNWTGNTERYVVRRTTDPMGTGGSTTTVIGSSTYTHNTGGINYFYVVEGYDTDCGLYSEPAQTTGVFSFDIIPGG